MQQMSSKFHRRHVKSIVWPAFIFIDGKSGPWFIIGVVSGESIDSCEDVHVLITGDDVLWSPRCSVPTLQVVTGVVSVVEPLACPCLR